MANYVPSIVESGSLLPDGTKEAGTRSSSQFKKNCN